MIGIYKITSPSNKIYIGQSINIKNRFKQYKKVNCKTQIRLYNSFLKYGIEKHTFEIIEECSIELLNERERYWQDYYNVLNNGLNCILTKTNEKKHIVSKETKEKLRTLKLGKKTSEETKNKIRNIRLGSKMSKESSLKKSLSMKGSNNHFFGKKHSKETIDKIKFKNSQKIGELNNFYGKNHSEKTKNILSLKRKELINNGFIAYSKKVKNINTNKIYESLAELCRCENLIYRNVICGINKKYKKYNHIKYVN